MTPDQVLISRPRGGAAQVVGQLEVALAVAGERPRCDVNDDVIATASFGGSNGVPVQSWNLCQFGSELIWQLPTGTNDPSGSVDIMAMLTWLENHGNGKYLPSNSTLTALGFGFEICSTGKQNETFQLNAFTLTATPS